jgi:type I restriction enzyme M protein
MNMILHGIEAPNIVHTNTLNRERRRHSGKDRFDIILANPPFGGKERKEVQQNFPIRTGETAFLFLQHFIKRLRAGGRAAAIVIKNTFLSNTDNASRLRKELLESCNLHTILDCPAAPSSGRGEDRGAVLRERARRRGRSGSTSSTRAASLGKTNPLNDADLAEFVSCRGMAGYIS